ncbi:hypothetical protein M0811_10622 [Anaeramoeba ignava]|uniref:Uncharacterized protein n=1 Tax=Anaeramoeba ignava TaxID=1746090 RepID=A0A9Q0LGN6_ANAIG|nr:hypothetical protein M0811_10622 [Anaeramoeba ignava]
MGSSKSKIIKKKEIKSYLKTIREAKEAMTLVTSENTVLEANDLYAKLFGLKSREDIVNKPLNMKLLAPFQPQLNKPLNEAMEELNKTILKDTTGSVDFYWLQKDIKNEDVWVHVYLTFVKIKGKMCFQCIVRKILNPLENEIKEKPLDQSLYLVNPRFIGLNESESSQKEKDSFIDDSKSTTDFSDLEAKIETDSTTFTTSNSTTRSKTSTTKTQSTSNILLLDSDEFEMRLDDKIDTIKSIIRANENPKLEKKVIDELNEIKSIFEECNKSNQTQISKLADRLKIERERNKDKYNELESHLQKNLEKSEKTQLGFELAISKIQKIQELTTDPNITQFFQFDFQEEKKF